MAFGIINNKFKIYQRQFLKYLFLIFFQTLLLTLSAIFDNYFYCSAQKHSYVKVFQVCNAFFFSLRKMYSYLC